ATHMLSVRRYDACAAHAIRRHPLSAPLFPYTTLFRSASGPASAPAGGDTSFPRNETLYTSGTQYGPPSNWNPIREWDYATGTERSEEHTSELQSREKLVCRLLLEKNKHWPAGRRRRSA